MDTLKWCRIYVSLSYVHPSVVTMCPHSVSQGSCRVLGVDDGGFFLSSLGSIYWYCYPPPNHSPACSYS